jgi:predicted ester cyclase
MSTEENKAVIRRIHEEVINKGDLSIANELISPDYVLHAGPSMPMEVKGPEGFKQFIGMFLTGMPDTRVTVEDVIAEGDKVVHRFTLRGTHTAEMMGLAPTGKKVEISGTTISRMSGGKEAEAWMNTDSLTMYQQLGVIPPLDQGGG